MDATCQNNIHMNARINLFTWVCCIPLKRLVKLISLLSGFNTVADSCECVHWRGFNDFIVFARCISEDNDAIVLGVLNEKCLIFSGTNLRLEREFGAELHLLVEGVVICFASKWSLKSSRA